VAVNHASYIDPLILLATMPMDVRFIAKRGLTRYPVLGTVIRRSGYVTIEKADLSDRLTGANDVATALAQGDRLVVFPEGTFARAPGLLPFRLGAFRASVETGQPILPVALRGTRQVLPDGARLCRRGPIAVIVGELLTPRATGWPEMVRLRDETRRFVARESGEQPI
jgi:1-acyl-sn-glycerol-3-phosphate acyltransferase